MKSNKHKIVTLLFLFIFLSAFSSGIYASITQSLSHHSKNKEIKPDSASASNDFVFEENETENEEEGFACPELTQLTSLFNLNFYHSNLNIFSSDSLTSEDFGNAIFLTIRSLRI